MIITFIADHLGFNEHNTLPRHPIKKNNSCNFLIILLFRISCGAVWFQEWVEKTLKWIPKMNLRLLCVALEYEVN